MSDPQKRDANGASSGLPAEFHDFVREAGRGFILAFSYGVAGVVSALIGSFGRILYGYVAEGAESQAAISNTEKFSHGLRLGLLTTIVILVLSLPVAWLPLSTFLAVFRRLRFKPMVACLFAGFVTAALLAVWVLFVVSRLLHVDDADRISFWLVIGRALPFAVPAGGAGGLVFWALCYRAKKGRP